MWLMGFNAWQTDGDQYQHRIGATRTGVGARGRARRCRRTGEDGDAAGGERDGAGIGTDEDEGEKNFFIITRRESGAIW